MPATPLSDRELEAETKLTGPVVLMRNVHPKQVQQGFDEPSPTVFSPTDTDAGLLSIDRDDLTTADATYTYRREVMGKDTVGVLGVTADEVSGAMLDSHADPIEDNPAHGLVDFRPRFKERREIREVLLARATARGWLHGPI